MKTRILCNSGPASAMSSAQRYSVLQTNSIDTQSAKVCYFRHIHLGLYSDVSQLVRCCSSCWRSRLWLKPDRRRYPRRARNVDINVPLPTRGAPLFTRMTRKQYWRIDKHRKNRCLHCSQFRSHSTCSFQAVFGISLHYVWSSRLPF